MAPVVTYRGLRCLQMPDQLLKPKIKWPRWAWRDSGWWLTVFGAVFAAVIFVQPAVAHHSLLVRLAITLGWFVLSSVLLLAAEYAAKVGSVLVSRLRAYEGLSDLAEQQKQQIEKAQEVIVELSQELTNGRKFEIEKTLYYNEMLYLVLKRKRGAKLEVGHTIRVIDAIDGGIMGVFRVNDIIRSDGYRAVAEWVDPVWLGFVHQDGKAEMSAPPNGIAIFLP